MSGLKQDTVFHASLKAYKKAQLNSTACIMPRKSQFCSLIMIFCETKRHKKYANVMNESNDNDGNFSLKDMKQNLADPTTAVA